MRNVLERILNLLAYLLTSPRPVTADDIRHTVAGYDQENDAAFQRMFSRDKELLRKLGIPLETRTTGVMELEYGYVIDPDSYRLPETNLTDEERTALWFAAQVVRIGGQPSGADAILKLGGSRLELGLEPFGADLGAGVDVLADLYTAAGERRPVEFVYNGKHRTVHPHGLGHRRGHWYLVAVAGDEVRVFRVDRISDLELGDAGGFERREDVDMRAELDTQPWEIGDATPETATVRFSPEIAWWAERRLGREPRSRAVADDGSMTVSIDVSNPDAFVSWVLGFGDQAEVVSPQALRDRVIDRIRGVA